MACDAELDSALRSAHHGEKLMKSIASTTVHSGHAAATDVAEKSIRTRSEVLTQREREVLGLLVHGHTNQAIAERLFRSTKTVETHRARIVRKLGLKTRADLVQYAIERGLFRRDGNAEA
jgi:DNA-binding NarL/FixJ family response regulator